MITYTFRKYITSSNFCSSLCDDSNPKKKIPHLCNIGISYVEEEREPLILVDGHSLSKLFKPHLINTLQG